MSEANPCPTIDGNGLPLCDRDNCALYDGKRCMATGFRPDRFCEPALVALVEERDRAIESSNLYRSLAIQASNEKDAALAHAETLEALAAVMRSMVVRLNDMVSAGLQSSGPLADMHPAILASLGNQCEAALAQEPKPA